MQQTHVRHPKMDTIGVRGINLMGADGDALMICDVGKEMAGDRWIERCDTQDNNKIK